MSRFNPERWTGREALRASLIGVSERIADLARIGIGFGASPTEIDAISAAYKACRDAPSADLAPLLHDPWTFRAVIQAERAIAESDACSRAVSGAIARLLQQLAIATSIRGRRIFECVLDASWGAELILPGQLGRVSLPRGEFQHTRAFIDLTGTLSLNGEPSTLTPVRGCNHFELVSRGCGLPISDMPGQIPFDVESIPYDCFSEHVGRAMAIVEQDPESLELVTSLVRALLPLQPAQNQDHLSSSIRDLPGVVAMDLSAHIVDIAEALVHEADHQRYYIQTDTRSTWSSDNDRSASYRSPWRPDPRPLDGLLAGASAFSTIGLFFARIVASAGHSTIEGRSLGERSAHASRQSLTALNVVREHAAMTDFGRKLVETCSERATTALSLLARHPSCKHWEVLASRRIARHDAEWSDVNGTICDRIATTRSQ